MSAVVQNTTPIAAKSTVEAEELGLVTVIGSMFFHTGVRREDEIANQNPSSPTTKVYVMLMGYGPYIANAVEDHNAIRLTHLQKVESKEGFMRQISREVDRAKEGEAFLLSAWSVV